MLEYVVMREQREKQFRKKAFILGSMYMFFCMFFNSFKDSTDERDFVFEKNSSYSSDLNNEYAYYKGKNIYIVDEEVFEKMKKNNNDIYLLDFRNILNSNVQIYNSRLIHDKEDMYNILGVLLEYDKEYPNDRWNRSLDGMYLEWYLHNVFYDHSILKERSRDVDLDTRDIFVFENPIVKKLLLK